MTNFWAKLRFLTRTLGFVIVIFTQHEKITAQTDPTQKDSAFVRQIYNQALSDGRCYPWLHSLTKTVGHRISGSPAAEKAVKWARSVMDTMGLDSVWLQPVMVPRWVRGEKEQVSVVGSKRYGAYALHALALGGSVGTPAAGLKGQVVEVKTWEALEQLGEKGIKGKIVFFNRPMDPTFIHTFEAYGGAVDQRSRGASRAAKYGAIAVLVRSMGLRLDDFPHTGGMHYDSTYALIPAAAISTNDAEKLSALLAAEGKVTVTMKMNCRTLPDAPSFNVIGEIRGRERPNEYLVVGGHLDSWDVGEGAHDDGAGCTQSMDVLRILKQTGYKPRRTVRCVLFMNEENGLRGGREYAREAKRKKEYHWCSIESDEGGFTPRGFSFEAEQEVFNQLYSQVKPLERLFEPYGLRFSEGGSGADIGPLKELKGLLSGYQPDPQRYFDYHHTAADVFEAVNKRELELGAGSIAALVYLLDKYGK